MDYKSTNTEIAVVEEIPLNKHETEDQPCIIEILPDAITDILSIHDLDLLNRINKNGLEQEIMEDLVVFIVDFMQQQQSKTIQCDIMAEFLINVISSFKESHIPGIIFTEFFHVQNNPYYSSIIRAILETNFTIDYFSMLQLLQKNIYIQPELIIELMTKHINNSQKREFDLLITNYISTIGKQDPSRYMDFIPIFLDILQYNINDRDVINDIAKNASFLTDVIPVIASKNEDYAVIISQCLTIMLEESTTTESQLYCIKLITDNYNIIEDIGTFESRLLLIKFHVITQTNQNMDIYLNQIFDKDRNYEIYEANILLEFLQDNKSLINNNEIIMVLFSFMEYDNLSVLHKTLQLIVEVIIPQLGELDDYIIDQLNDAFNQITKHVTKENTDSMIRHYLDVIQEALEQIYI